jgi:large subunit ribosomal protein L9
MPTVEVILTEKIETLGAEADVVKVKRGYARNFLVPHGKALEVTPATLKRINQLSAKRAEREAKELNEADELARRINKLKITLELETGESGKAFGSIPRRTSQLASSRNSGQRATSIVIASSSTSRSRRPAPSKCRSSFTRTSPRS